MMMMKLALWREKKKEGDVEGFRMNDLSDVDSSAVRSFVSISTVAYFVQ
jgi:hypothetical protein